MSSGCRYRGCNAVGKLACAMLGIGCGRKIDASVGTHILHVSLKFLANADRTEQFVGIKHSLMKRVDRTTEADLGAFVDHRVHFLSGRKRGEQVA